MLLPAEQVVFKGYRGGIKVFFHAESDFTEALTQLRAKLASSRGFFEGASLSFITGRELTREELQQLVDAFSDVEVKIVSIAPQEQAVVEERPKPAKEAGEATMLVRRTVRSGQRLSFDGNIVVLGDVNPGGEIVATGDVVVLGTLRGTVHAGATGNAEASVTALRLMPMQLRIAHLITRAPDEKAPQPKHMETARIRDGAVVVGEYEP